MEWDKNYRNEPTVTVGIVKATVQTTNDGPSEWLDTLFESTLDGTRYGWGLTFSTWVRPTSEERHVTEQDLANAKTYVEEHIGEWAERFSQPKPKPKRQKRRIPFILYD